MDYFANPQLINFEVTQRCSFECPQCYCQKDTGKDLDFSIAKAVIKESAKMGVKYVNISGGETLLYPHLIDLLELCFAHEISTNIAISGVGFNEVVLKNLIKAGVYGIYVSINGSTENINAISRNGFIHAIKALDIISKSEFPRSAINWVMQSSNAEDFSNMIKLAENYNIQSFFILMRKPDSDGHLDDYPTKEQIEMICTYIRQYTGNVEIVIDKCFSQMKAVMGNWIFGNVNNGIYRGCTAGIDSCSLNVDGTFSPCRHLLLSERFCSLQEYWTNSVFLNSLRTEFYMESMSCRLCTLKKYCRPCVANLNIQKLVLEMKNTYCPFCNTIKKGSVK